MKKLLIIPALLFSFCSIEAKIIDRILVKVNEEIITQSDLDRAMKAAREDLAKRFSGPQLEAEIKKVEPQALDYLIEETLLYQKAVELEYDTRSEPKVSAAIQEIIKKNNLKDTDDLDRVLREQGSSLRELREDYQKQISIEELKGELVSSRITLLPRELEKYYKDHIADYTDPEEIGLSEIIIPIDGGREEAEKRANEIYRLLQEEKKPFAELASQYSKGATAHKGGVIGTFSADSFSPEINKAIAGYKEGEVTKPQLMKEGYVIFRIDSRKAATVVPFSDSNVQKEIKEQLWNEKFEPELERFIAQLKEDAYIEILPEIDLDQSP